MHTFLDGQFQLAPGVIQLALLLEQFGLSLLCLGQLFFARLQDFLQLDQFAAFAFKLRGAGKPGLPGLFGDHPGALGCELLRDLIGHLLIERALRVRDLLLLVT